MYEAHFGFTGAPFGLNPDPAFYFGSKGHSHALAYLQFGVHQGEGFVVATGEIGAGKTTLVRTLLAGVDRDRVVAAQIVSTQLEAGDLLRSVALAFGLAPKDLSKAELIATIEAFLTLLVTQNRRALLIVDEAQNLSREAVEELRMLSNFQLGNQALLQSFLVGQPELRVLLTSKAMEQFRQRVIASCHLGPMDRAETQAYIEHRLRQVGWTGTPAIDEAAHDRVFTWSGGVPRRVNVLFNRLLLSAFLHGQTRIDAGVVDAVAQELRGPVGHAAPRAARPDDKPAEDAARASAADAGVRAAARAPASAATAVPTDPAAASRGMPATAGAQVAVEAAAVAQATRPAHAATPMRPLGAPIGTGPLLMVSARPLDDIKLAMLMRALKAHACVPAGVRVRIGDPSRLQLDDPFILRLGVDAERVDIGIAEADPTERLAVLLQRLGPLVDERRPAAIVVVGGSEEALACALVARRKGCRLVQLEAGAHAGVGRGDGALIDAVSDLGYAADGSACRPRNGQAVDETPLLDAGSLLVDAVRAAAHRPRPLEAIQASLHGWGDPPPAIDLQGPYGLVLLDEERLLQADREAVVERLAAIHPLCLKMPLLWPIGGAAKSRLDAWDLAPAPEHERIARVRPVGFADQVALLNAADWVATDSPDVQRQASALHVRCIVLDDRGPGAAGSPPHCCGAGGEPASRAIAEHLAGRWHAWSSAGP